MNITKNGGNGVTFYGSESRYTVYNGIDVEPSVKTVEFPGYGKKGYRYAGGEFSLKKQMKSFPNVEELVIEEGVLSIDISNNMFPNVKRIISHSERFRSGTLLIDETSLLNTFCKKEGEEIDLTGVNTISDYAFQGCLSTNITHADDVKVSGTHAFHGYIGMEGLTLPYMQIGSLIPWINPNKDSVVLQDDEHSVTFIRSDYPIKKLSIKKWDTVQCIASNYSQEYIELETLEVTDQGVCSNYGYNSSIFDFRHIKHLVADTPYVKCIDDVLYTRDGLILLQCLPGKTGKFVIPEGVEEIAPGAFTYSQLSSVKCPDSLKSIGNRAFECCDNLSYIDFGHGISVLGYDSVKLVSQCPALKELTIPESVKTIGSYTFSNCNLEKLILPEGLIAIGGYAFSSSQLESVDLPSSLQYVEHLAFGSTQKICVNGSAPKGLLGSFLKNLGSNQIDKEKYNDPCMKELHYRNALIHVPEYLLRRDIDEISHLLPYDVNVEMFDNAINAIDKVEYKQEVLIRMYLLTGQERYLLELRNKTRSILNRYIRDKNEKGLIRFLKLGITSVANLQSLLKKAQELGMTTATAYILKALEQIQPQKKRKTFTL